MYGKQVDSSHYTFSAYMDKQRWASVWHQVDEVLKLSPDSVLEAGPGPGLFKLLCSAYSTTVKTIDIDPDLNPDYVGSITELPFPEGHFDVTCAFQVLEHLPFSESNKAFSELSRVARRYIIISLPDSRKIWRFAILLPFLCRAEFMFPRPRIKARKHKFDGEHYWEINKAGFKLHTVIQSFESAGSVRLIHTYRVMGNPYHRFMIFEKHYRGR